MSLYLINIWDSLWNNADKVAYIVVTILLVISTFKNMAAKVWQGEATAHKERNTRLVEERREQDKRISALMHENEALKSKTDLEAVQAKLDAFVKETQKQFEKVIESIISAFKDLVVGLNAEGVKRYDGAVKQVNDNTDKNAEKIIEALEKKLRS